MGKNKISKKIKLICSGKNVSNVWAIGEEKVIFVDCGTDEYFPSIEKNLKKGKIPFPSYLLVTHCHFDHVLSAHIFAKRGTRIISHRYTKKVLEKDTFKVWPENPSVVNKTYVDISFSSNLTLNLCDFEITFLSTPGHTPGCACYLFEIDGKKYLFTGDLFFPDGNVGWKKSIDFNIGNLKKSLEKIKEIDFDFILPGHGGFFEKERGKEIIELAIKNTANPL